MCESLGRAPHHDLGAPLTTPERAWCAHCAVDCRAKKRRDSGAILSIVVRQDAVRQDAVRGACQPMGASL